MPIDFKGEKWITQSEFAKAHNVSMPCVCNYIRRKQVKSRYFEDVKRTMIKVGSLVLTKPHKVHPETEIENEKD